MLSPFVIEGNDLYRHNTEIRNSVVGKIYVVCSRNSRVFWS